MCIMFHQDAPSLCLSTCPPQVKKVIVVVDAITNGFWGFMWFVCFCFTANERRLTNILNTPIRNCANSGVAFSFFNIFVFVSDDDTCMYEIIMMNCRYQESMCINFVFAIIGCNCWMECVSLLPSQGDGSPRRRRRGICLVPRTYWRG